MKKKLAILPFFVFFTVVTQAQLNASVSPSSEIVTKELPAKLFTQFIGAVNPTSLVNSFEKEKTTFLNNAKKVNSPEITAKNISAFAGYIKPDMFKSNFNVNDLMKQAAAAKKMSSAMSILKNLEAGLKPEALSNVWKLQKGSWIAEMNKFK
jgi:hypothetical protein